MTSRLSLALKLACLALLCGIGFQARSLLGEWAAMKELIAMPPALSSVTGEPANAANKDAALETKAKDEPPALAEKYKIIETSAIFGMAPKPEGPPVLVGIAGMHAIIRTPDGKKSLVAEGAEQGGVKLLRIGTNRVLVEFKGKQIELTLFAGFGGESLLPVEQKTKDKDRAP